MGAGQRIAAWQRARATVMARGATLLLLRRGHALQSAD